MNTKQNIPVELPSIQNSIAYVLGNNEKEILKVVVESMEIKIRRKTTGANVHKANNLIQRVRCITCLKNKAVDDVESILRDCERFLRAI